jgi:hypothetical protein
VFVTSVGVDCEAASLSTDEGKVSARGVGSPSNCPSCTLSPVKEVAFIRGEDVVRYPKCDGWVDNGGLSGDLYQQELDHVTNFPPAKSSRSADVRNERMVAKRRAEYEATGK